jgi:hypothetical protein
MESRAATGTGRAGDAGRSPVPPPCWPAAAIG